jgi:hypothetical protein
MLYAPLQLAGANKWRRCGFSGFGQAIGFHKEEFALAQSQEGAAAFGIGAVAQHIDDSFLLRTKSRQHSDFDLIARGVPEVCCVADCVLRWLENVGIITNPVFADYSAATADITSSIAPSARLRRR